MPISAHFFDLSKCLVEVDVRRLTEGDFDRATIDVSCYFSMLRQYLERAVVYIANLAAELFLVLEVLLWSTRWYNLTRLFWMVPLANEWAIQLS